MKKTALIIGGTGFIGHALCSQLLSQGIKTHVIARHADKLPQNKNLHTHKASMDDTKVLAKYLPECSHVFFVASDTIPGSSAKNPMLELESNLKPTLAFLDTLQKFPDCHLIFFSSGGTIYGNPEISEVTEEHALSHCLITAQ